MAGTHELMFRARRLGLLAAAAIATGVAFAQSEPEPEPREEEDSEVNVVDQPREPLPSAALEALADRLSARERALERRERNLEERESDLNAAEARVVQRLEELTALRTELEEQLGVADEVSDDRVVGVVRMFEAMRSSQGADVMTEMEAGEAVRVLDRMNRTKAGKLLAAMDPALAAGLASRMARPIRLVEQEQAQEPAQ